jgi:MFS family permease
MDMPFSFSAAPPDADDVTRRNFRNVQIDAIAIGLTNAAAPFLPVFLARLGASNLEVGLLTTIPAVTGLLLALAAGRFLHAKRNIVPWFSLSRLLVISAYALTGAAPFLVPPGLLIPAILAIWAAASIPQTVLNVTFSVVMNAVAGPERRYELLSRRWTILGFTTAVTVLLVGGLLDRIGFPVNYQAVFLLLSVGGLISFHFSSRISLPEAAPAMITAGRNLRERFGSYFALVRSRPDFVAFIAKRFVYMAGISLAQPIFPLYFVREVHASDTWIGAISMVQTAVVLVGYPFWARQSRVRGGRFVLVATTLGASFYPLLAALTRQPPVITAVAGLAGIFQAGIDLVFFDELMKTVPGEYCALFVSIAQEFFYLSTIFAPLLGILLAGIVGLGGALVVSWLIRLTGAALFAWGGSRAGRRPA